MEQGYIKLWRKSLDCPEWHDIKLWRFWEWCLLKANWEPKDVKIGQQVVHLEPGQFIFGRRVASEETGLSEQSIRTALEKLTETSTSKLTNKSTNKCQNLTIKSTNKFSIITISKWHTYQTEEVSINQQINQQTSEINQQINQQINHNEEDKEEENRKFSKKQKTSLPKLTFQPESDELKLSELLRSLINQHSINGNPIVPEKTNMQAWAKDINLLHRIDNRSFEEIEDMIRWCQADLFWKNNILSPRNLRKHFSQMTMKRNSCSRRLAPESPIMEIYDEVSERMREQHGAN